MDLGRTAVTPSVVHLHQQGMTVTPSALRDFAIQRRLLENVSAVMGRRGGFSVIVGIIRVGEPLLLTEHIVEESGMWESLNSS